MITIDHSDEYPYCYRGDDEGITSANDPSFWYALCMLPPRYPMPAILPKHSKLVHLGYVSAENGFSIEAVFNQYVRIP